MSTMQTADIGAERHSGTLQLQVILPFFMLISVLAVGIQSFIGNYLFMQSFSVLLFCSYLFLLLTRDTLFFSMAFLIIFNFFAVAISTLMIENGAYLIEIRKEGYCTGATTRFVAYAILFLNSAYLAYALLLVPAVRKLTADRSEKGGGKNVWAFAILLIYSLIALYLLLVTLRYGSPLFLGLNRVNYWNLVAPAGTRYIVSLIPQLNILLGTILLMDKPPIARKSILYLAGLGLLIQIFQGDKFSGLVLAAYFFFIPTLIQKFRTVNLKINYRFLFISITIASVFIGTTVLNYAKLGGSLEFAKWMFMDRVALQGQVWWAIDEGYTGLKPVSYVLKHILGFGAADYERGLYHLMAVISPSDVFLAYFTGGGSFTGGFPAIFTVSFGYELGAFFTMIIGLVCGAVLVLLLEVIERRDLFTLFFAVKLFFATYFSVSMGSVDLMFTFKYLFFLLICLFFRYFTLRIN
jgi:hypothetical protein